MPDSQETGYFSRRDFLKRSSSVAAGAVGLAALGSPAVLRAQNLNSRINIGVLGTGSRGCFLMRIMSSMDGVTITDVCDIYPPHLDQGRKASGNTKVRAHENWEKVLEQPDVDAVLVSAPLFLHVPMSVASLKAGKHVYSEKSMGLNVRQLNEITETAGNSDKVYLVGFQSRFSDSFLEAKRLIRAGSIGQVTQFYLHYDRNSSWRKEIDDPKWERVLNWRMYKEYCGGILTELLTHDLDQVLDILGTMPAWASCSGRIKIYQDGRDHHDSLMGVYEMEDGVIGAFSGHLSNSRWGSCWMVHGTHGTIEAIGGGLRIFWEKETRHLTSIGVQHTFTKVELGQSLNVSDDPLMTPDKKVVFEKGGPSIDAKALMHFFDCIRNGTKPVIDAPAGRRTSIAALMAYTSSMNGGRKVTREEVEALG